jgi:hypothetical protein
MDLGSVKADSYDPGLVIPSGKSEAHSTRRPSKIHTSPFEKWGIAGHFPSSSSSIFGCDGSAPGFLERPSITLSWAPGTTGTEHSLLKS